MRHRIDTNVQFSPDSASSPIKEAKQMAKKDY
jgi:hypothetical protein